MDFLRAKQSSVSPVSIQGTESEAVQSYRYMGVCLNNKLNWTDNATALHKKGQRQLYILRRLRLFSVQGPLLKSFCDSAVASAIFYVVVCWGSSSAALEKKRLNKLTLMAGSVLGCSLDTLEVVTERRMMAKFQVHS